MTTKSTPRIRMPATAKAGEVVEVKTLISHEMESGQRKDKEGKLIPRKIINKFVAKFNGQELMTVDWHAAVSANPLSVVFFPRAGERNVHVRMDRRRRFGLLGRTESHGQLTVRGTQAQASQDVSVRGLSVPPGAGPGRVAMAPAA